VNIALLSFILLAGAARAHPVAPSRFEHLGVEHRLPQGIGTNHRACLVVPVDPIHGTLKRKVTLRGPNRTNP